MNKLNGKITKSATLRGAMTRGAGGGTYVEANPEGEATDTLEKLMVEDTIYNVRNVPDASSAHNGDVLTKTTNGVVWSAPPETGVIYSTEEQEIGAWIDGRKVYQKTYYVQNLINDGEIHYFADLTVDKIISLTGSVDRVIPNLGVIQCMINSYEAQNYKNNVRYDKYTSKMAYSVYYYPNGGESAQNLVVTIKYIKVGE